MNEATQGICTRLREEMKKHGITQRSIADESGMKLPTINKQHQGLYPVSVEFLSALMRISPSCDIRYILNGEKSHDDHRLSSIENRLSELEEKMEEMQ